MAFNKKALVIGIIIIVAIVTVVRFLMKPVPMTKESVIVSLGEKKDVVDIHADRIVMVEARYKTPVGSDPVSFSLSVGKDGVVTKAETGILGKNSTSIQKQQSFATALPTVVVGKKLSDLSDIDRIGGASLTTNAFNVSLEKLKSQL